MTYDTAEPLKNGGDYCTNHAGGGHGSVSREFQPLLPAAGWSRELGLSCWQRASR